MRAIIGPNGAGKTTMMDVVTGKTRPDDGQVYFDGNDRPHQARRDRRSPISASAANSRSRPCSRCTPVEDNLVLALKSDRAAVATLFWRGSPARSATRIDGILDTIRLTPRATRRRRRLSHGQKQWLEIGMLLAQEPKLLLVDEPVAGMTDAETQQTAELLKRDQPRRARWSWSSTTWLSCATSASRSRCLHEGSVLAEGTHRPGVRTTARDRSLSGPLSACSTVERHRSLLRRRAGAARRLARRPSPARSPACSAATASARPACCARMIGQHPISARHASARTATISPGCRRTSARGAASPTCRRAARSFRC